MTDEEKADFFRKKCNEVRVDLAILMDKRQDAAKDTEFGFEIAAQSAVSLAWHYLMLEALPRQWQTEEIAHAIRATAADIVRNVQETGPAIYEALMNAPKA